MTGHLAPHHIAQHDLASQRHWDQRTASFFTQHFPAKVFQRLSFVRATCRTNHGQFTNSNISRTSILRVKFPVRGLRVRWAISTLESKILLESNPQRCRMSAVMFTLTVQGLSLMFSPRMFMFPYYSFPLQLPSSYHLQGAPLANRLAASRNYKHSWGRQYEQRPYLYTLIYNHWWSLHWWENPWQF